MLEATTLATAPQPLSKQLLNLQTYLLPPLTLRPLTNILIAAETERGQANSSFSLLAVEDD